MIAVEGEDVSSVDDAEFIEGRYDVGKQQSWPVWKKYKKIIIIG